MHSLKSPSDSCRIQLRTLSKGEKHPLAECTAVLEHFRRKEFDIEIYSIRICGNYVGILLKHLLHRGSDLVVWSWKTGVKNLMVSVLCTHVYDQLANWFIPS